VYLNIIYTEYCQQFFQLNPSLIVIKSDCDIGLNSRLDLLSLKKIFSTISSNLEFIKLEHSCVQDDDKEGIFVKNELKTFTMLSGICC